MSHILPTVPVEGAILLYMQTLAHTHKVNVLNWFKFYWVGSLSEKSTRFIRNLPPSHPSVAVTRSLSRALYLSIFLCLFYITFFHWIKNTFSQNQHLVVGYQPSFCINSLSTSILVEFENSFRSGGKKNLTSYLSNDEYCRTHTHTHRRADALKLLFHILSLFLSSLRYQIINIKYLLLEKFCFHFLLNAPSSSSLFLLYSVYNVLERPNQFAGGRVLSSLERTDLTL